MADGRSRARVGGAIVAALVIAAATCTSSSDDPDPQAEVLVGEVDGGKGLIAVVHDNDALLVYACGLDGNLATHTGWFFGVPDATGSSTAVPKLRSAGGLEVAGRIEDGAASGTLRLADGKLVRWEARRARGGGGLYGSDDSVARAGLIVSNDGRPATPSWPRPMTAASGGRSPSVSLAVPPRAPTIRWPSPLRTVPWPGHKSAWAKPF